MGSLFKKINPDELFVALLIDRRFRLLRHVALIVTVLLLGISNIYLEYKENDILWQLLINCCIFVPILLNVYVFTPKLLFRNKGYTYALAVILSIAFVLLLYSLIQMEVVDTTELYQDDYGSFTKFLVMGYVSTCVSFSLIMAGTTSLMILQAWLRDRERISQLESAGVQTELEMLKNQINPHFLFNMLNNAIVLTKEDAPKAREIILKLKQMLNYQLEKSTADKILVCDDIEFLDDLLGLEKVRRDRFEYFIMVDGQLDGVTIPPLLMIPFVENAIKHGNDNTGESYILIVLRIRPGRLDFFCTNSIPAHSEPRVAGGLGLTNIKRRLELIYGTDHSLEISGTEKTYNVNLTIKL